MSASPRILIAAVALTVCGLVATERGPAPVSATGTGPTIAVGSPSLVNGLVQVPIIAWYPVANAYSGFSLHLRCGTRASSA